MQVVMKSLRETLEPLWCFEFSIAMERLVMKNVFTVGERVSVYVNDTDSAVYTFDAPGGEWIDEKPGVLAYVDKSARHKSELALYFSKPVEEGSFEATFRVIVHRPEDTRNPIDVESVALVHFETMGKKLAKGKRYVIKMSGVSSVFHVCGRSHQSAIYSFAGSDCDANETPVHRIYFPYTPGSQLVQISKADGSPLIFCLPQYFRVVLSIHKMDRTDIVELKLGCNASTIEWPVLPYADSAVIVTSEKQTCPKIGMRKISSDEDAIDRYEVALVRLSARNFEPRSRVLLEVADTSKGSPVICIGSVVYPFAVYSGVSDDNGVIDVEPKYPLYHMSWNSTGLYTFGLTFRHHPSGEVIEVADGSFEAVFHLRAL